jgi:hypothetical protein
MFNTENIEYIFVSNIHLICIGLIALSMSFLCCQKLGDDEDENENENINENINNNIIIIKNLELPPPYKPEI